ncbi:MAG: DUF3800 domain-containing protein [Alphaproteobacteria bacterium]
MTQAGEETLTFYMDESGFTGERLMSPEQPVFIHVSTRLGDDRCRELHREFFGRSQADELKHSALARRPAGRERIVRFIEALRQHAPDQFTAWYIHKEFTLLTYLVDLWVENAAYRDGLDLYRDGGNLALCNMAYFCLPAFKSRAFLSGHLTRFQTMMMRRTPENYRKFWGRMQADYERADQRVRDILASFLIAERKLAYGHLAALPPRSLDPLFTTAVSTCGHWRGRTGLPLRLVHDSSSSLVRDSDLWGLITSPDMEPVTLGIPGRETEYPLNVQETVFADSRDHLQLQFCDLLAGASAVLARNRLAPPPDKDYCERLEAAGIEAFSIGGIWPAPHVDPDALGMRGWSGASIDAITDRLAKLDRDRSRA